MTLPHSSTQPILLNPGPVNVHPLVKRAIAGLDMCHREPEFFELQEHVRLGIVRALNLDIATWAAVLMTGSGTCAVEAMIASLVPRGSSLIVLSNGVYGDRIAQIARAYGIHVEEVVGEPSSNPDLKKFEMLVDDAVQNAQTRGTPLPTLAAVHHETTTGLLNPVEAIGALAKKYGLIYLLDTVSSLAGEAIDLDAIGATAAACTANKCFEGLPGICFVLARREAVAHAGRELPRSMYMNLPNYLAKQDAQDTPFTPAIQVLMALEAAVNLLHNETVPKRIQRYANYSRILREGAQKIGLSMWLSKELQSNTITTFALPAKHTYESLHDAMRAQGYVIYAGQGDLRTKAFRIANMGQIPEEQMHRLVRVLGEIIS